MHLSATQEDSFPPASYLITVVLSMNEWAVATQALAMSQAAYKRMRCKLVEVGRSQEITTLLFK